MGFQTMRLPAMPPKHLPPGCAFEADDILRANGLPDQNSRVLGWWFWVFPERHQRLVDGVDDRRNVSQCDLVLLDVLADDLNHQWRGNLRGRVITHRHVLPLVCLSRIKRTQLTPLRPPAPAVRP